MGLPAGLVVLVGALLQAAKTIEEIAKLNGLIVFFDEWLIESNMIIPSSFLQFRCRTYTHLIA